MKKNYLFILLILIFSVSGCGGTPINSTISSSSDAIYSKGEDKEAHYLIFYVNSNEEIGRMLVIETDTYESLEPYFPTIPVNDGYYGYWEKIDKVYDEKDKEIRINAYIIKE